MRPVDYNITVGRAQDFSQLKQAEDSRPMVEQQTILQSNTREIDHKQNQVNQKKDEDMDSDYDASKDGRGPEYEQNSGKKRKKKEEEDGRVVIKSRATFDVKI